MNRHRCICGQCDGLEDLDAILANHKSYQKTTHDVLAHVLPGDCIGKVLDALGWGNEAPIFVLNYNRWKDDPFYPLAFSD